MGGWQHKDDIPEALFESTMGVNDEDHIRMQHRVDDVGRPRHTLDMEHKWVMSLNPHEATFYAQMRERGADHKTARRYVLQGRSRGNTPAQDRAKPQRRKTMKSKSELRNIAAMLSDDIVSVECVFHGNGKAYTYKAEKSLALAEGDLVTVSHGSGEFKTIRVKTVHKECLLPDTEEYDYQWIVGKVSEERFDELRAWEDSVADELYTAQRSNAKRQMLEALGVSDLSTGATLALPSAEDAEVIE